MDILVNKIIIEINPNIHEIKFNYELKRNQCTIDGNLIAVPIHNHKCPYDKEYCKIMSGCEDCIRYDNGIVASKF